MEHAQQLMHGHQQQLSLQLMQQQISQRQHQQLLMQQFLASPSSERSSSSLPSPNGLLDIPNPAPASLYSPPTTPASQQQQFPLVPIPIRLTRRAAVQPPTLDAADEMRLRLAQRTVVAGHSNSKSFVPTKRARAVSSYAAAATGSAGAETTAYTSSATGTAVASSSSSAAEDTLSKMWQLQTLMLEQQRGDRQPRPHTARGQGLKRGRTAQRVVRSNNSDGSSSGAVGVAAATDTASGVSPEDGKAPPSSVQPTATSASSGSRHTHRGMGARADDAFPCVRPNCSAVFSTRFSLRRHVKRHEGHRPYVCTHSGCTSRFAERSTLKRHERIHTGERPFACTWKGCGKRFADLTNIRRHIATHERGTVFLCPAAGCKRAFRNPEPLKRHKLLDHGLDVSDTE